MVAGDGDGKSRHFLLRFRDAGAPRSHNFHALRILLPLLLFSLFFCDTEAAAGVPWLICGAIRKTHTRALQSVRTDHTRMGASSTSSSGGSCSRRHHRHRLLLLLLLLLHPSCASVTFSAATTASNAALKALNSAALDAAWPGSLAKISHPRESGCCRARVTLPVEPVVRG